MNRRLSLLCLLAAGAAHGESLSVTTYYPAPSGVYRNLIAKRELRVGGSETCPFGSRLCVRGGDGTDAIDASFSGRLQTGDSSPAGGLWIGAPPAGILLAGCPQGGALCLTLGAQTVYSFGPDGVSTHGRPVRDVAEPSLAQDAATKAYVDRVATQLRQELAAAVSNLTSMIRATGDPSPAIYSLSFGQTQACCRGADKMIACVDNGVGKNHGVTPSGDCCTGWEGNGNGGHGGGVLLCAAAQAPK